MVSDTPAGALVNGLLVVSFSGACTARDCG